MNSVKPKGAIDDCTHILGVETNTCPHLFHMEQNCCINVRFTSYDEKFNRLGTCAHRPCLLSGYTHAGTHPQDTTPKFYSSFFSLLSPHLSLLPQCRLVEVFGLITLKDVESVVNMTAHVVS